MHGRRFVPARLIARRVDHDLTTEQLSARSGISERHIRRLETGERTRPSDLTVAKLARSLDCTIEDLSVTQAAA